MAAKKTDRERRIVALAQRIVAQMKEHPDRLEAIDAVEVARVLFRKPSRLLS